MTHCGRCHWCHTELSKVLDGEEWCFKCQRYQRYRSHGWHSSPGPSVCPHPKAWAALAFIREEFLPQECWGEYVYQLTDAVLADPEKRAVDLADGLIEAIARDRASMGY